MKKYDKIDILVKRADLIYKKLLIFLAIAGGSWVYGLKNDQSVVLSLLVYSVFILSSIGIVLNLLKYGMIQKELEEMEHD